MTLIFTKLTLLLLSVYGWYALFVFGYNNGSLSMITDQRLSGCLGDACVSYTERFTGIARVDQHLAALLTFFWPVVDGSRPDASLHGFYFTGQGIAVWMATLLEGLRDGNKWHVVSFTTVFGLFFQTIGMAIIGPLFLLGHLVTSPTVSEPTASSLSIDFAELQALPFSIVTGVIVPTVLMSMHAPTYMTSDAKAFYVRLWQVFPLLCYLSQHVWKRIIPLFSSSSNRKALDIQTRIRMLRKVYFFGVGCAAAAHIGAWSISLSAYLFPTLFAEEWVGSLVPANIFFPPLPWSGIKADSAATGAHWLLQWDNILCSSMYLIWALSLLVKARQKVGRSAGVMSDLFGLLGTAFFVGPAGTALCAMWERDEIVLTDQLCKEQGTKKAR